MASVKGRNSCIVKLTRLSNLCCTVASAHWSSQGSRSANKPGSKPSSAAVDPSRISVLLYVSMGCIVLMADRNLLIAQDELAAWLGKALLHDRSVPILANHVPPPTTAVENERQSGRAEVRQTL